MEGKNVKSELTSLPEHPSQTRSNNPIGGDRRVFRFVQGNLLPLNQDVSLLMPATGSDCRFQSYLWL
jgi:hypothetical protein